jgi:lipid-A-disaccharide synthase
VKEKKSIYLVSGEPSGDFIGSEVMSELLKIYPDASFCGVGGQFMEGFNFKSIFPIGDLSVMGILPVLLKIKPLLGRINQVVNDILNNQPDIVMLIDSPDFNHRVANKLRKKSFKPPIVCYVAPTVWAWREKRVTSMSRDFNHLLSILPFEKDFFDGKGLSTTYVGHPIIPEINKVNKKDSFKLRHNIKNNPVLVFLPGSRTSEIKRHIKPFRKAFDVIKNQIPNIVLAIPIDEKKKYLVDEFFNDALFVTEKNKKLELFKEADVACAASGTVTLELGLSLVPMVVIYKLDFLTWSIVSRLAKVKFVSLVNLVLNKSSVSELLQKECNSKNISESIISLLKNKKLFLKKKKDLLEFKKIIENNSINPSRKAAETISGIIEGSVT